MNRFTLNTRTFGEMVFTTSNQDGRGYVYCNGQQICSGGRYMGSTIQCTPAELESVARKWYAQYYRNYKANNQLTN